MAFVKQRSVRSIEDVRILEQTPMHDAIGIKSTYEIFVNSAKAFGNQVALRFLIDATVGGPAVVWTYQDLLDRLHQTANLLHSLGMGKTDTVSVLLPGCSEYHLALWGGEAAGIVNPLNPLLSEEKLASLMNACQAKVLIAYGDQEEGGYWDKARRLKALVPSLETILRVAPATEDPANRPPLTEGALHFQDELAKQEKDRLVSGRTFEADDVAAYFHTGGTTGSPKLAIHTHFNQVFSAWASVQMQGLTSQDITINGYPLFHVAGVLPGSLASLSAGVETIIPTAQLFRNKEVIRNYWKLVDYHKATTVSAVPTALAAIARHPLDGADVSRVHYCRTGAAPLPPELAQRYERDFGLHVHESLGMTEMAGITSITPPGVIGPVGSVGFPLPYCRVMVGEIGPEGVVTENEMPQGDVGMLLVKSPNVFPGYLQNEEDTQKAFTSNGWLISGDIGYIDEAGRVNLSGRAKDLIIRSGHNIDPKTIEDVLDHHEAVDLCAAVAEPCGYAGELPVAFVTLKEGYTVTEEELMAYMAARIEEAPAKPKSIGIIGRMPQTNVGKIFKPELRRIATENAIKQAVNGAADVVCELDAKGRVSAHLTFKDHVTDEEISTIKGELFKFPVQLSIN